MYYSDYGPAALEAMAAALVDTAAVPTWCIFDNTAASHALGNALTLTRLLRDQARTSSARRRDSSASAAMTSTAPTPNPALR